MSSSPFLIIGGGIAGLAAAIGLARRGLHCLLFEQAHIFSEVGAGLQITPNAVKALQALDAWDAVRPHCSFPRHIHLRDAVTGERLKSMTLAGMEMRHGAPYGVALRFGLLAGLLEVVRSLPLITLKTGLTAELLVGQSAVQTDAGQFQGRAVIVADGVHSRSRVLLSGRDTKTPHPHLLFRKLLPAEEVPVGLLDDAVNLWLGPGGHVVHYTVDQGASLNIVASISQSRLQSSLLARHACSPLRSLLATEDWLVWPAFDLEPDSFWAKGTNVRIGDAAHAALPHLAQGAALALEDAAVLPGYALRSDISEGFKDFARVRYPRASAVQSRSRRQGKIYHMAGPQRLARDMVLRSMPEKLFSAQLDWLYSWMPE